MHQRPGSGSGGDLDLAVGRGQGPVEPQVPQRRGHPQDEQCLGLVSPQPAQREPVAVHQPAPAAGPGFGDHRDACGPERLEVAVHGPDRHPEFGGQVPRGRPAARLQEQDQGHQPVGAHRIRLGENR